MRSRRNYSFGRQFVSESVAKTFSDDQPSPAATAWQASLREIELLRKPSRACGLGEEAAADYQAVDLRSRGIGEAQASDLRARLRTFAEDWDRPEAAIYDEDPTR